mmetsp:Transcript_40245/g.99465  ORF Transcript_40245/g.99465 Transcript_40245/m.99465 type:complete len:200 (+) Transcript_40245:663-1262(+)
MIKLMYSNIGGNVVLLLAGCSGALGRALRVLPLRRLPALLEANCAGYYRCVDRRAAPSCSPPLCGGRGRAGCAQERESGAEFAQHAGRVRRQASAAHHLHHKACCATLPRHQPTRPSRARAGEALALSLSLALGEDRPQWPRACVRFRAARCDRGRASAAEHPQILSRIQGRRGQDLYARRRQAGSGGRHSSGAQSQGS